MQKFNFLLVILFFGCLFLGCEKNETPTPEAEDIEAGSNMQNADSIKSAQKFIRVSKSLFETQILPDYRKGRSLHPENNGIF